MSERPGIHKTSLRLPPRVKAAVRRAAAAEGCSMNRWMVEVLQRHVTEMEARSGASRDKSGKR